MKFIHCADLHLDAAIDVPTFGDCQPAFAAGTAFRKAVDLAIQKDVDFFLIAGDLFHKAKPNLQAEKLLVECLSLLNDHGIPVVACFGNHDPVDRGLQLRLPKNTTLLSAEQPEQVRFDDLGVVVHGRSYPSRHVGADFVASYPRADDGWLNIGLLHSGLAETGQDKSYAPCSPAQLARKGYDYWALGHVHQRFIFTEQIAGGFAGNPQGIHINETGQRGVSLVTRVEGKLQTEFQQTHVLRWEQAALPNSENDNDEDLETLISQLPQDCPVIVRLVSSKVDHQNPADREKARLYWHDALARETNHRVWLYDLKVENQPSADEVAQAIDPQLAGLLEGASDDCEQESKLFQKLNQRLAESGIALPEHDWDRSLTLARSALSGSKPT